MVGKKIIVADDSVTVQKVMKLILAPKGYDVECYNNGGDALTAIRTNIPAIVFADVKMPEMNGIDLGAELKKRSTKIPLVLLYSTFDEVSSSDYAKSGAVSKISKPFDDNQILDAVEKLGADVVDMEIAGAAEEPMGTQEGAWTMDQFVEPEMPDLKAPINTIKAAGEKVNIDLNLNDDKDIPSLDADGFFNINADEFIADLGVPEPAEVKTFKQAATPPSFNIPVTGTEPLSEENISEDEAKKLLDEFKLRENPDGTIKFDDIQPEKDLNLWDKKRYTATEKPPLSSIKHSHEDVSYVEGTTHEIIENMVKKMLPDIAEKIIREEIKKLVGRE